MQVVAVPFDSLKLAVTDGYLSARYRGGRRGRRPLSQGPDLADVLPTGCRPTARSKCSGHRRPRPDDAVPGARQPELRLQEPRARSSETVAPVIDIKRLRQDPDAVRAALRRRLDPAVDGTHRRHARPRPAAARAARPGRGAQGRAQRGDRRKWPGGRRRASPRRTCSSMLKASGDAVKALDAEVRADRCRAGSGSAQRAQPACTRRCPTATLPATRWCAPGARFRPSASRPKPHWELGEALGLLDLPRGAKISGSGLPGLHRDGRPPGARAGQLHARPAHPRARLHARSARRSW